jgi:phosphate transport system permease protein
MIFTVLGIIFSQGITFFWPKEVTLYQLKDDRKLLGILRQREVIPLPQAKEQKLELNPHRRLIMVANRDLYGQDFVWVNDIDIVTESSPKDVWVMERREYGNFIGYLSKLTLKDQTIAGVAIEEEFSKALKSAMKLFRQMYRIEKREIGSVNARLETKRLEKKKAERSYQGEELNERLRKIDDAMARDQKIYESLVSRVNTLRDEAKQSKIEIIDAHGTRKVMPLMEVVNAWKPNAMSLFEKIVKFGAQLGSFFWDDPREANTEGGIFPAIFGTTLMVILMSVAVVPFGVLTAFYLSEYAKQGVLVRTVRIALNNLAGVPSIVYGVFGLGFFVYFVGGSIDRLFYPDALPSPTWGTGGILWASLTLALMTVPVVVMATEESISAVPRGMREGSLALGASKFQTLTRILLPASLPGILTGVILAMARGAGEVAPLMITGVVKLAPSLPLDTTFPFVHFERKFMHLGFHIYDTGFQSPNVEAARPMVFATALLLIFLVIALNLGAILLRDRIRKKYTTGAFN